MGFVEAASEDPTSEPSRALASEAPGPDACLSFLTVLAERVGIRELRLTACHRHGLHSAQLEVIRGRWLSHSAKLG